MIRNLLRALLLLVLGFVCAGAAPARAQADSPTAESTNFLPLDQVKPGMHGTVHTIFAGKEIDSFGLEVLGVLRNLTGPGQDVILVRLLGDKVNYTGVVAGMSGSPVTIDGKLVGALSYRFGVFTKEPIGGVTPIENMVRAAQEGAAPAAPETDSTTNTTARYPVPEDVLAAAGVRASDPYLVPIETPLSFVGFTPQAISHFSEKFAELGLLAVQGGGTAAPDAGSPLEPGGAVSAALVTGDMSVAATCTITYRAGDQLFACGHPVLGLGSVALPMARAQIVATVPSEYNSFKIANIGDVVGSFQQDRATAITGRLGPAPRMIPVSLTLVQNGRERDFHYKIFQHPKISPLLLNLTLFNGLFSSIEAGAEQTYRITGRMRLRGHSDVVLDDMFSPTDSSIPDAFFVVNSVGETFRQVFTNPFESPDVEGVNLRVELLSQRHSATIENAWSDKSEVSPGETLHVKVVLKPYRGERSMREVEVTIPEQAAKGDLRLLVSDARVLNMLTRTLFYGRSINPAFNFGPRVTSLDQLISLLNRERRNDRLYVTVFQRTPTLLVEDKVLPSVPLSQINVLNQRSGYLRPGGTMLFYESILKEASEPLGQVITGSHWLSLKVR